MGQSALDGSSAVDHEERLKAALADRYQIERENGSGGMAVACLARDSKLDLPFGVVGHDGLSKRPGRRSAVCRAKSQTARRDAVAGRGYRALRAVIEEDQ